MEENAAANAKVPDARVFRNPSKRQSFDSREALRRSVMIVPYRIPPTTSDIQIANAVTKYTSPGTERAAGWLSLGADQHVLLALVAGWWLYCRGRSPRARGNSDHILLTTLAVSAVPHLLKTIFDQRRPDRLTVRGHLHGVPFSGRALDAFPSGHCRRTGVGRERAASRKAQSRLGIWRRPSAGPGRPAHTLGKRCCRRPRARRVDRAPVASPHRLRRACRCDKRPSAVEGRGPGSSWSFT
jgi:hypothetical protein